MAGGWRYPGSYQRRGQYEYFVDKEYYYDYKVCYVVPVLEVQAENLIYGLFLWGYKEAWGVRCEDKEKCHWAGLNLMKVQSK